MASQIPIEKEFYYISNERYKGTMPSFFTEDQFPQSKIIKENYPEIKAEIEAFFKTEKSKEIKPGYIPHSSWDGNGWKSIGLYVFGFKRNKNCNDFPILTKIAESIPEMTSAQISILKAGKALKPHIDDTTAVVRIHLGIDIPGELPELAFRMSCQEVTWKEGEVMILSPCRPHTAWNKTNEDRVVVIVDVVHDQYKDRKLRICGNVIAQLLMKGLAGRFPMTKKIPKRLILAIQKTFGFGAFLILSLRHSLKI